MAGRHNKHSIHLTDEEYQQIQSIIRKKTTSLTLRRRCEIILARDDAHGEVSTYEQCSKSTGVCMATVSNTVSGFCDKGMTYLTSLQRNDNSNQARRKVDGRAEAKIIEIACGPVPEGHSRWTLRLLEDRCRIVLEQPVSKDTIRRTLKKTNFDLT